MRERERVIVKLVEESFSQFLANKGIQYSYKNKNRKQTGD